MAQSLYGFTRGIVTLYVQQYNFSVQYQLPKGWLMEVGYIGSHGRNLLVEPSLNQALLVNSSSPETYNNALIAANGKPGGVAITRNSNTNATLRVPVPGFAPAGLNLVTNEGYSHYNGFILELNHAFAHGFQCKMDYTQSRSTDNDSGPSGSDLDSFTNNQLYSWSNRGVSDFNQPHRFVFTGLWNIPGPKKGWREVAAGNWGLSGVYTVQSGFPFSLGSTSGGGLAGLTGSVTVRANSTQCAYLQTPGSVQQNLNSYIDPACFSAVPNLPAGAVLSGLSPQQGPGGGSYTIGNNGTAGDPGTGSLFGASGRNILQGPGEQRFDLALTKAFRIRPLGEAGNLMFRAEAFKVFNNAIFSNPQANISNSNFGHILSTVDGTGRILQLALKLAFWRLVGQAPPPGASAWRFRLPGCLIAQKKKPHAMRGVGLMKFYCNLSRRMTDRCRY